MKKQLEQIICDHFNLSWKQISSKSREQQLVNARLIYYHIAVTEMPKSKIAEILNVDRTELYHYRKIFSDRMFYAPFANDYFAIEREYYTFRF